MKTELVPVLALVVAAINAGAGKAQESTTDGLCAITCDEEAAEAACGSPLATNSSCLSCENFVYRMTIVTCFLEKCDTAEIPCSGSPEPNNPSPLPSNTATAANFTSTLSTFSSKIRSLSSSQMQTPGEAASFTATSSAPTLDDSISEKPAEKTKTTAFTSPSSSSQTTSSIGSTSGYSSRLSDTTTATGSTSSASVTLTTTTPVVISADQSRPSSHLSIGAGVGVAIAAGAVTICVGSLAWFLFVRRHKRPAQTSSHAYLVAASGVGRGRRWRWGPRPGLLSSDPGCEESEDVGGITQALPPYSDVTDPFASQGGPSSMGWSPSNGARAEVSESYPRRENIGHGLMSEKPFRRLMDEIVPTSDPEGHSGEENCAAEGITSLDHIEHGSSGPRRYEVVDGGVRTAWEESREVVDADQYRTSEGSTFTFPPPYSSRIE